MIKKVTNRFSFLLGVSLLLLCAVAFFPIKAKAIGTDLNDWPSYPGNVMYSIDYNIGETVNSDIKSNLQPDSMLTYFTHSGNAGKAIRYFVTFQTYGTEIDELVFENDCDGLGYQFLTKEDFKCQYDKKTRSYIYTANITYLTDFLSLSLINYSEKTIKYTFTITAEPEIVLDKTAISEITNTKSHTMTVKYAPVKKRLGYQIEYADNSKFNNKARVNTGATKKDVGKLTIGKTYYVRVRVYARYDNGTLVYSKWSGTRKIKIKK